VKNCYHPVWEAVAAFKASLGNSFAVIAPILLIVEVGVSTNCRNRKIIIKTITKTITIIITMIVIIVIILKATMMLMQEVGIYLPFATMLGHILIEMAESL
jgi:hypothetical protein